MLRFATGIAPWLPGVSAGSRLGLEDRVAAEQPVEVQAKLIAGNKQQDDRLPTRDDAFYWSLMHSHL